MTALMVWAIIGTSVIVNPTTREILPFEFTFVFIIILGEIYGFFIVGYIFPGQALCASRATKQQWRKSIIKNQGLCDKAYQRKLFRACSDVKLRFGSVNYYGRTTALVVVQFVIEKSLKVMLLLKK